MFDIENALVPANRKPIKKRQMFEATASRPKGASERKKKSDVYIVSGEKRSGVPVSSVGGKSSLFRN